jgi:hypothetical protein
MDKIGVRPVYGIRASVGINRVCAIERGVLPRDRVRACVGIENVGSVKRDIEPGNNITTGIRI